MSEIFLERLGHMMPDNFSAESLRRLRNEYPRWDIRYHPAPHVPDGGLFVASLVPAPGLLQGIVTTSAPTLDELRGQLAVHDRVARAIGDAAGAAEPTSAEAEDAVVRIQRQYPHWRIRYETKPAGGRFVAARSLTSELAALGLLGTVTAEDEAELANRLAYQDALTVGAAALTLPTRPGDDGADVVTGCEELLRRAAEGP